jgi:hypothetical protein
MLLVFLRSIKAIAKKTLPMSATAATIVMDRFGCDVIGALGKATYVGSCSSLRPLQTGYHTL